VKGSIILGQIFSAVGEDTSMAFFIAFFYMELLVFGSGHNLKILQTIISLVTILVVDDLIKAKRSTKMFFHDYAVFFSSTPITVVHDFIRLLRNSSTSRMFRKAFSRAIKFIFTAFLFLKRDPAISAIDRNLSIKGRRFTFKRSPVTLIRTVFCSSFKWSLTGFAR